MVLARILLTNCSLVDVTLLHEWVVQRPESVSKDTEALPMQLTCGVKLLHNAYLS